MCTKGYLGASGPDLQRIVSGTFELLIISGSFDNLMATAEVSLKNLAL